ncbi:hypothetical protein FNV43_RR18988 [Rhamnella rubrinervis]|uniref:AAA+ ATPase At3g28540-like C-terminal domain-containing protein n=1 Tax=Rhamnella rubrinervis TaxID=2594499 RepID=A0A8K0E002_9ROSA|nr:hypothetical protein FNV43_RR18988 [Rhamnella rubrinervis]
MSRPDRMDVHVHMSNCTPCVFKLQGFNYLGIKNYNLFEEVKQQLQVTDVTPAEMAQQLITLQSGARVVGLPTNHPDTTVQGLIESLNCTRRKMRKPTPKRTKKLNHKLYIVTKMKGALSDDMVISEMFKRMWRH